LLRGGSRGGVVENAGGGDGWPLLRCVQYEGNVYAIPWHPIVTKRLRVGMMTEIPVIPAAIAARPRSCIRLRALQKARLVHVPELGYRTRRRLFLRE